MGSSASREPAEAAERAEPDAREADSAFAGPELAGPELAGLRRLDPIVRARAVARLQRSAGNAAVARRLAGARAVARKRAEPLGRRWTYDRSAFGGRFDGEVDLTAGTMSLILKVRYVLDEPSWFVSAIGGIDPDAHAALARFKRDFPTVVHQAWSFKHALKPACPIDGRLKYEALARVEEDDSNPHAEITLMRPKALVASEVDKRDDSGGVTKSILQADDNKVSTSSWKDPKTGVDKARTHDDEYGVDYVQASDIMGHGTGVSKVDYEPWVKIARAYGAEAGSGGACNGWTLVEPG